MLEALKPEREFIEGHWYPCVGHDNETVICRWDGLSFSLTGSNTELQLPESMKWVGESLGKINFGDK